MNAPAALPALLRDALASLCARLEREWPARVEHVILFGPWARGEDSDVAATTVADARGFVEKAGALVAAAAG
ncbi:MAG: hypothetical protein KIT84_42310 [Labilithrix sp.]|nr:hypothetical protein [Labilithrix sp.]MCW5817710.1 hypothetical protein [Labilithrix sp.]